MAGRGFELHDMRCAVVQLTAVAAIWRPCAQQLEMQQTATMQVLASLEPLMRGRAAAGRSLLHVLQLG
jgi:hypothetical protein